MVNDVEDDAPIFANGPDDDVELNTPYHAAPSEGFQDIKIELDDFAVAVIPVGVAGGAGSVVADAGGLDCGDVPPLFDAWTT